MKPTYSRVSDGAYRLNASSFDCKLVYFPLLFEDNAFDYGKSWQVMMNLIARSS